MTFILYLLKIYSVYLLFFIVISILGGMILYVYQFYSKKKWTLSPIEIIFISYFLGLIVFISFSYILSFLQIFNIISIYLPIAILLLIFLIYLRKQGKFSGLWNNFKKHLKISKKNICNYILIILVVVSLEFVLLIPIISEKIGLLGLDSYYWAKQVLFLLENGTINYTELSLIYPPGFVFFLGGNLLISPDFITVFYFIKLGSLPFLNLYILLCFIIFKRIFKNKWLILTLLIVIISNTFFEYRIIQFLSSSISIFFVLIGFLILLTDIPKYFLGLIIAGSFLTNPIYALYFSISLLIFYIIKLSRNHHFLKTIVNEIFAIILLAIIAVSPYIISVYIIYHNDLVSLLNVYTSFFRIFEEDILLHPIDLSPITNIFSLNIIELIQQWVYFGFFIIFPVIGILLIIRKKKERTNDFSIFIVIGTIFTLFMIFISPLFNLGRFFDMFFFRILEAFLPLMVILIGYSTKAIINYLQELLRRFSKEKKKFLKFLNQHQLIHKIVNLPNFLILLILSSSFLVYIYAKNNFIYSYRYDDSIIECIFYVRENISPNTPIGVNYINISHSVYDLIFDYNIHYYDPVEDWTLDLFSTFTAIYNLEYFIINLSSFNEQFINEFITNSTYVKILGGSSIFKFGLYSVL